MHPIATLHMKNGKKIVIELFPESEPNTVNSFIYVASKVIWTTMPLNGLFRETGWISVIRLLEGKNANI